MKRKNGYEGRTPGWCWLILAVMTFLILPGRGLVVGQNAPFASGDKSTTGTVLAGTTIIGRVLDQSGTPAADVPVCALVRSPTRDQRPGPAYLLAQGRTDAQGAFRLMGRSLLQVSRCLALERHWRYEQKMCKKSSSLFCGL